MIVAGKTRRSKASTNNSHSQSCRESTAKGIHEWRDSEIIQCDGGFSYAEAELMKMY